MYKLYGGRCYQIPVKRTIGGKSALLCEERGSNKDYTWESLSGQSIPTRRERAFSYKNKTMCEPANGYKYYMNTDGTCKGSKR